MQAIGLLIIGPLSDKFGRKYPLLLSIAFYTAASVFCSLAPTIQCFIILRCIHGFSASGIVVIPTALIKDCFCDLTARRCVLTLILGAWII